MSNNDLPTYAIIELLIRLTEYNPFIGSYKDHIAHEYGVMVTTSAGHINLDRALVTLQLTTPQNINKTELIAIAGQFKKAA